MISKIVPFDENGTPISNLVQWDKNVYIYIKDLGENIPSAVQFFNNSMTETLVVDSIESVANYYKVKIPNILLTHPKPIIGYINITNSTEVRCKYMFYITVREKPMPSDYIYVESDDYITIQTIRNECKLYAQNAKQSEVISQSHELNASNSATEAEKFLIESERNKNASSQNATESLNYSNLSKSYAVGTNNSIRDGDSTDNAKYYYERTKNISQNIVGILIPISSISFRELASVSKETGYTYNIKDSFITDSTFKEGAGYKYPAGTNVYYTSDGFWDCLSGRYETVNNLNTSDTGYPLDAYQGKILKDMFIELDNNVSEEITQNDISSIFV